MSKKEKLIKVICQIIFFIWIPESFAVILLALRTLVSSIALAEYSQLPEAVLVLLGSAVSTVFFGRYYCGYICSFGAMQDLTYDIGCAVRKNQKKILVSKKTDAVLSKIKYIILAAALVHALLDVSVPGELRPWTSFGMIASVVKGNFSLTRILSTGLFILIVIVLITVFFFRAFCRYLCPVGAFFSLISFHSYDRRHKTCGNSGDCTICQYKCGKYKIHYPGLIVTILIFTAVNLYLAFMPLQPAEETSGSEVIVEKEEDDFVEKEEDDFVEKEEAGAVNTGEDGVVENEKNDVVESGPYTDGVFESRAFGYRGDTCVTVIVEDGRIVSIEITDSEDDRSYVNKVREYLIPEILVAQSTEIDAVSGATYTSEALFEAVERALNQEQDVKEQQSEEDSSAKTAEETGKEIAAGTADDTFEETDEDYTDEAPELSGLEDGVYEGTGTGFRGELKVAVTVKDHAVEAVRILSYYDNEEYLFHAASAVIDEVVNNEPLDVDAVSGATYSANGLTRAIADALQMDEDQFDIMNEHPREAKHKQSHHIVQKFIESDEEQEELIEKYRELMFGPDGKRLK